MDNVDDCDDSKDHKENLAKEILVLFRLNEICENYHEVSDDGEE